MIGLKKFKGLVTDLKEGVQQALFPTAMNESVLPKDSHTMNNGEKIWIRPAIIHDLNDIILIQEACYDGEAPWGRIAVNNELRNKRSSFFLMGHHNDLAVAFIGLSMRKDSFHITNIATMPEYQKQGIATFLIQTATDIARKLEKNYITLEVRVSNEKAKSLYRKMNFTDGRIKRNYYHNNGEDALDMIYRINEMDE